MVFRSAFSLLRVETILIDLFFLDCVPGRELWEWVLMLQRSRLRTDVPET